MFIQPGCISGGKSETVQITQCELQGICLTLRNSTVSSIRPFLSPSSIKEIRYPTTGDTLRSSPGIIVENSNGILVAASVNGLDNGDTLSTQYEVPNLPGFTGWENHGTASSVGQRLGVASNSLLINAGTPVPEQVDFEQNFPGEDSLTTVLRYFSSTGDITVVDEGTQVSAVDSDTLTIPIGVNSLVGDTVLLIIMAELYVRSPSGFTWEYTDNIQGRLNGLTPLETNTNLSVFRKVLTSGDIASGEFTISTSGV